jgi:hypothetical protein
MAIAIPAPRVRVLGVEAFEQPFRLRMPFRFGAVTLTEGIQAIVRVRLRLGELGVLDARGEDRNHLPLADKVAVVEAEPDQPLGHGRRQGHLLVGERVADSVDRLDEADRRRRLDLDQRRLPVLFLRAASPARRKRGKQQENKHIPAAQHGPGASARL